MSNNDFVEINHFSFEEIKELFKNTLELAREQTISIRHQAEAMNHQAEAMKYQAEAMKHQTEATNNQAETIKNLTEAIFTLTSAKASSSSSSSSSTVSSSSSSSSSLFYYTSKDILLDKFSNWIFPVNSFNLPCYACQYYGHSIKQCPNIAETHRESCTKCWRERHGDKSECIKASPSFRSQFISPVDMMIKMGLNLQIHQQQQQQQGQQQIVAANAHIK